MVKALAGIEKVGAPNQVVEPGNAKLRHDGAHLFGHEEKEIHHMLRPALKLLTQDGILRSHPHGAGVQMAFAHHDAACRHQGCRCKAHLIGTQQGSNHHLATGLHLAVGLNPNAATKPVEHQGLLGLGKANLPGRTCMLNGRQGRGACAAVVACNNNMISLGLSHARSHGAHTNFRDELDRDIGMRGHILQVVNKLGKVLNGINVVVRRGRDKTHTWHRMT